MGKRIGQLIVAELYAFGTFVCGGLAALGAAVTWTGESQHSPALSWALVSFFASMSVALGTLAAGRLRLAFARSDRTSS